MISRGWSGDHVPPSYSYRRGQGGVARDWLVGLDWKNEKFHLYSILSNGKSKSWISYLCRMFNCRGSCSAKAKLEKSTMKVHFICCIPLGLEKQHIDHFLYIFSIGSIMLLSTHRVGIIIQNGFIQHLMR